MDVLDGPTCVEVGEHAARARQTAIDILALQRANFPG
jgi:hypothetical protein